MRATPRCEWNCAARNGDRKSGDRPPAPAVFRFSRTVPAMRSASRILRAEAVRWRAPLGVAQLSPSDVGLGRGGVANLPGPPLSPPLAAMLLGIIPSEPPLK
jgi:hypothetical protein